MSLSIDPPFIQMPAAETTSVQVNMTNGGSTRLNYKVKCTDVQTWRIQPVYGFIDAFSTIPLEVQHVAGPPKRDRLIIQYCEPPTGEQDPKAMFMCPATYPEVTVDLQAA